VVALVDEVFAAAAGPAAATAVRNFLQEQRVTALSDLQYLELPWLQVGSDWWHERVCSHCDACSVCCACTFVDMVGASLLNDCNYM
jgi:hypothetical protein